MTRSLTVPEIGVGLDSRLGLSTAQRVLNPRPGDPRPVRRAMAAFAPTR